MRFSQVLACGLLITGSVGQLSTCDPETTECSAVQALGMEASFIFDQVPDDTIWNVKSRVSYSESDGALLEIANETDWPWLASYFYIMYGRVEYWQQAATGSGITTSMTLNSDVDAQIFWAVTGDNSSFSVGRAYEQIDLSTDTYHKAFDTGIALENSLTGLHNYTIDWTEEGVTFYYDEAIVYSTTRSEHTYWPQTPMNINLELFINPGIYQDEGIDWTQGPYKAYIKNITVTDYTSGASYAYALATLNVTSITVGAGTSKISQTILDEEAAAASSSTSSIPTSTSSSSSSLSSSSSATSSSVATTTAASTPTSSPSSSSGLSTGAKAGIGVGAGLAVVVVLGLGIYFWHRRAAKTAEAQTNFASPDLPSQSYPGWYGHGEARNNMAETPSDMTTPKPAEIYGSPAIYEMGHAENHELAA